VSPALPRRASFASTPLTWRITCTRRGEVAELGAGKDARDHRGRSCAAPSAAYPGQVREQAELGADWEAHVPPWMELAHV
jgi:hypothetical protein